jgi:hypothetical protein
VTACSTVDVVVAMLDDEVVFDWLTGPSSPGLKSRIEMFVLQVEHGAGGGAALAGMPLLESHPQFQFQTQLLPGPVGGVPGAVWDVVPSHPQFQFQTQVSGPSVGSSDSVPAGDPVGLVAV